MLERTCFRWPVKKHTVQTSLPTIQSKGQARPWPKLSPCGLSLSPRLHWPQPTWSLLTAPSPGSNTSPHQFCLEGSPRPDWPLHPHCPCFPSLAGPPPPLPPQPVPPGFRQNHRELGLKKQPDLLNLSNLKAPQVTGRRSRACKLRL